MTYLFIGAGQAGSAIVDNVFEYTNESLLGLFDSPDVSAIAQPLVFNSTMRDLQNLSNVPQENQYGIAREHGLVQGTEAGFEEMVTGGFGRSPVDANEVMSNHAPELQNILEDRFSGGASVATDGGKEDTPNDNSQDSGSMMDDLQDGFDKIGSDSEKSEGDTSSSSSITDSVQGALGKATNITGSSDNSSGVTETTTNVDKIDDSIQFAFIFFGLGGGTGCGISPEIARGINRFTDNNTKIIAVPILPNTEGSVETDDRGEVTPGRQAWNARYGLNKIEELVDGVILIDNQRISYLNSAGGEFGEYNEFVASAFHDMIAGPLLSSVDASEIEDIDTPDIDVRDIVTSLSFGVSGEETTPGYGAIGRSVTMTKTLPGYLLPAVGKQDIDTNALVRLSIAKQTLANADAEKSLKAISLIRAPKANLGPGEYSVKTGTVKQFLEQKCGLNEVNLGVAVTDRNLASVTTLLTYKREDIDRIKQIEKAAEAYERENQKVTA